jgi:hypothetical protein
MAAPYHFDPAYNRGRRLAIETLEFFNRDLMARK